jgi:transposase
MPARPKDALRPLSSDERLALERLTQASSARVDVVRRARAVLAVADGQPFARAAGVAGLRSAGAVTALVRRFNHRGLGVLQIAPGRGRRPTYDPTVRAQIVATAQHPPDRKTDGTATWSLQTLERRLRRDGLPALGATTIRRVLEAAGSSYQKTRTWCPTGTAQRKRKAGVVTVVDPQTEQKRG